MTWIGACVVAAFLLGALIGSVFSREREDTERDQSHADKLNYPSDANQETSIAALARAQIALAKDIDAASKSDSAYSKKAYRVTFWTAIGVGTYTVLTSVIVIFSVVQYGEIHRFNKRQLGFFNDQLGVMRGQLEEMRLDQRPWVSIGYPKPTSDFQFVDPGAILTVQFSLHNYGKSPALNVEIDGRMPLLQSQMGIGKRQDDVCNDLFTRSKGAMGTGYTIFPNEPLPMSVQFNVDRTEIDAALKRNTLPIPVIIPVIIGCVRYVFGADGSQHKTAFVYNVMHTPPFGLIRTDQGSVAKDDVILITPNFGSGRTD